MEKYITEVIAPKLQGDGGWVEFVSLEGGELTPLVKADAEWTMPTFEPLYLQAVKKSEDGSMTVIRLCEQDGKRGRIKLPHKVKLLSMLEDTESETDVIEYHPFEIITIGI